MKKRIAAILILMMVLPAMLAVQASANGPGPVVSYTVTFENLPEGACYLDLLIPLETTDPEYRELVEDNIPHGLSGEAPIRYYHEDGYCSYTFHYADAVSSIEIRYGCAEFFRHGGGHIDAVKEMEGVKLAVLDARGNVIHVSETLDLFHTNYLHSLSGSACYDARTGELQVKSNLSLGAVFGYLLVSLCGLVFTVLAERIVAWLFRLGDAQKNSVIWVNILSQIMMRIGFVLVYPVHITSYPLAVALFEVLVYTGEFLVYGKLWKDVSVKKRLAFVCAANTVSLMLGLWVNRVLY